MTGVATAAAWLLAGVLTWAGSAKLRRPAATTASFADLRLPAPSLLAIGVPAAELATAALLIARPRIGAACALVLLGAFTAVLAARLRAGAPVACACFGSARSEPLSSAALLRNALLGAAAASAAAVPAATAVPPLDAVLATGAAAVIGMLAVALWDLRARVGRLWDNSVARGPEGIA